MVHRRVVTLLSPIECSIDDIGSRIMAMRDEVQAGITGFKNTQKDDTGIQIEFDHGRDTKKERDTKGLTRLVQGSVLPQVSRILCLLTVPLLCCFFFFLFLLC